MSKSCSFPYGFGITSTGKRAWRESVLCPTELKFFYLGHLTVQRSRCVNSPTCVTRNTSHKKHKHRQSYHYIPTCGAPLVITSSYLINTCRARSGWTSIVYCFRTIVIVSCLFIYKCTVVPDFRVACISSPLLNCQLLNHASTNESYATLSQLIVSRI